MFELNNTSVYEPIPAWGCVHNWMNIDKPVKYWVSSSTVSPAPDNAPIKQKRKCLICGGVEWHDIRT